MNSFFHAPMNHTTNNTYEYGQFGVHVDFKFRRKTNKHKFLCIVLQQLFEIELVMQIL